MSNPLLDAWNAQRNPLLDEWDRQGKDAVDRIMSTPAPRSVAEARAREAPEIARQAERRRAAEDARNQDRAIDAQTFANSAGTVFGLGGVLSMGTNWLRERARSGEAKADAASDGGVFDRTGSLLETGAQSTLGGLDRAASTMVPSVGAQARARNLEQAAGTKIEGTTSWEDVKAADGVIDTVASALRFGVETGIQSLPEMGLAMVPGVGLVTAAVANTGRVSQSRAESDGRTDATIGDFAKAAPFGAASAILDRTGAEVVFGKLGSKVAPGLVQNGLGRIAVGAAGEGVTEGAQSTLEYAGGTLGTERGFDVGEAADQALAGAVGGGIAGGVMSGTVETARTGAQVADTAVQRYRARQVTMPGVREQSVAEAFATITPEDEASALDTADIVYGRAVMADVEGSAAADVGLAQAGMPKVGTRVVIDDNGTQMTGTMSDWFKADDGDGVVIELDDGRPWRAYRDDINELGITVSPLDPTAEADAIDARLAELAAEPDAGVSLPPLPATEPPAAQAEPSSRTGRPDPVKDGGAVIRSIFGDKARVTSGYRGPDHPLSKKNPKSWHARSHAAVDMAPIPGMTFDQARKAIEAKGYTLIEALNEVGKGRTKHATGDHWHFVIGQGGASTASRSADGASTAAPVDLTAPDRGAAPDFGTSTTTEAPAEPDTRGAAAAALLDAPATVDTPAELPLRPVAELKVGDVIRKGGEDLRVEGFDGDRPVLDDGTALAPAGPPAKIVSSANEPAADIAGAPIDKDWTAFAPETGTLAIPRAEMPQIKAEHRGAMVNFLNARGIAHGEEMVDPDSLKPSQAEFSAAKVQKAMDYEGGDRAILVSADNHVLDGHHQWLAAREKGDPIRVIRLDAPAREAISAAHDFPSSTIDEGATSSPAPAASPSVSDETRELSSVATVEPALGEETDAAPVPAPPATAPASVSPPSSPAARIEQTASGKSVAVVGASKAEIDAINAAIPQAKAITRKDGALVYSKKYESKIGAALDMVAAKASPSRFGSNQSALTPAQRGRADYAARLSATPPSDLLKLDRDEWLRGYMQANKEAILADRERIVSDADAKMPEGYRLVNSSSGVSLNGPDGMVGGYLAPANSSVDVLERAARSAVQRAKDHAAKAAATAVPDGDRSLPVTGPTKSPVGETDAKGRRKVGTNTAGQDLWEDERGVRAIKSDGFVRTEPVGMAPSREGPMRLSTDRVANPEFLTAEELAAEPAAQKTFESKSENPKKEYGAANTMFTSDAAEKARALLKAKRNQLNAGFDPEIAQAGLTLMGYHIEAGARAFIDAARAVAQDLGMTPADLRNSLRSWYSAARIWMEDNGGDVRGMDDDATVKVDLARIDQWGATTPAEPAMEVADAQLPNRVPAGDAGSSAGDVPGTSQDRGTGSAPRPQGSRGEGDVSRPDRGTADPAERGAARSEGGKRSDRAGNGDADRVPAGRVTGTDWTIEPGSLAEGRGFAQKARDNLDAIALVKAITAEGRPATRDEQAVIARYVGWGGIKNIFPDSQGRYGAGFEEMGPRLRELLSDEEYETARRSIQYAHYTGETVVRGMWELAQRLGFRGGQVFEPGMGTGNFRGMMPAEIAAATSYNGLEYDHLTAAIAKLLYPQSGVRQADYTAVPMAKNALDLVIGNPPFSETAVSGDPEYGKHKFLLHDFFFAKSLDAVKPGGLLMFVTSAGTMNKRDTKARAYLADRADLVGAIRLPGNAFEQNAGTSVTTDIVVLRKREPGTPAADRSWVETVPVTLPDRDGNAHSGAINAYFAAHPEMILGEQGFFDKLVAGPRYAVRAPRGFSLDTALAGAIERFDAATAVAGPTVEVAQTAPALDLASNEKKDGSYYLAEDGTLMQFRGGAGQPVQGIGKGVKGGMSAAAQERVRGLIPIKDALRDVYAADLAEDAAKGDAARARLNAAYDAFVAKHGPINKTEITYRRPSRVEMEGLRAAAREEARLAGSEWDDGSFDIEPMLAAGESLATIAAARDAAREAAKAAGRTWNEGTFEPEDVPDKVIEKRPNLDPFLEDEEGYRLAAIEHYNAETGEAAKGRAFFENAVRLDTAPRINGAADGLLYSLNRLGRPDIGLIADMAKLSRSEVLEQLGDRLFEVPGKPGVFETAETYLSGNVREKLALAREKAASDPALERNVRALEAAQPAPLTPSEIAANLGMPWIPTATIEQFAVQHMGLGNARATYIPAVAQWSVAGDSHSAAATSTWGTERMDALAILQAALNRQTPTIRDKTDDGSVVNTVATQAVQDKMAEMKAAFREWVWTDETRAAELTALYNEKYNSLVAPSYDGTYLTTPGIAADWSWRPHQRAVIARIIQAGNTYMAHEVGAGKTSAMIGAGMEMKRLGLINKPMYVVPNHMLGQFTKEFFEQYPLARVRVADEARFHTSRRKEFVARMAADDLDAVIITHSAFGFIPMSDEFTAAMIEDQIAELEDVLAEIGKGQDVRITRRKIEQQKEALEQRLRGMTNRKRDQVFTFEETGVDFLFVDEAHLFRKLDFSTKMGNVKGIDPNGSQMSFDLFAKTRYLEQQRPGRNLVLASGTPITNTMAELYSVSRYLQQGELEKRGLAHFDAWAGAFGDTVTALEQDPAGGYKSITRFAQFVNVPELSVMVRQVMDVVGAAELRQYVTLPTLKGGERQMVVAEMTPSQESYKATLQARMEAIKRRSGPPQPGDDIILSVIGDGRKAAIDYRLIDASAPKESGSKLELLIDNVARLHKEISRTAFHKPGPPSEGYSAKPAFHGPATQMIFSDFGINGDFPVHKYIKQSLVARGVPASQIAIIADFKTNVAKQRLFNDMNEGKVRVLIGSVAKMGTGVNAQRRLRALHNMDAQWYPANDTQRNGRIIRQGNMNPEVEIFDYSTHGTYDSTMWAMMGRKAKFIEGFMRGDPTMRDMEDLGEASQYEQAAAMTTADPRVMVLTEWKQDLEKLERRRTAHERDQQSIRSRIRYAEDDKARAEGLIPLIEQDIAKRVLPEGDTFEAKAGSQTYDDRGEFGAALMEAAGAVLDKANGKQLREGVGEIGGFPIVAEAHPGFDGPVVSLFLKRAGNRETKLELGTDSRGLVTRLVNKLRQFESELANARSTIERADREVADYTQRVGAPFDDGGKTAELRAKIRELEATLDSETKAAEAAKSEAAQEPKQSIPEGDDLPLVATLTGSEVATAPDHTGRVRQVLEWYHRNLRPRQVVSSDGVKVRFARKSEGKLRVSGDSILRAVPAIEAIITQGRHEAIPASAKWAERGVVRAHRYTGNVAIDGQTGTYGVLVHEVADGRRYYHFDTIPDVEAAGSRASLPEGAVGPGPIELTPGGLNLFIVERDGNTGAAPDTSRLAEQLQARLEMYGLARKVALRIVDTLNGAAGQYHDLLVRIATDTGQDGRFTLDHEAIHALRDLGLFNTSEWAVLAAKAKRDTMLMRSIRQRYPKLSAEAQIEEAVADMFARFQRGDYKPDGTAGRVFKALRDALEAIRNWLAGRGAQTAEGVMGDVTRGEVGARDDARIFPPTKNTGAAQSIPERDDMVALGGSDPTWKGRMADAFDAWRTSLQDRYLPLLKVQRQIETQTGRALPPGLNPYLGEELMTGRIGARLERLAETHVQPLFDAMHEEKVSLDELETYLYARHAPERNARMQEINPDMADGEGSGMSDIEARAVMARIRKSGRMEAMERLAARVDAIRDLALDYRVKTGLMSQEQADEWRATYDHYVPLRGFKEVDGDPLPERMNRSAGGINVRGRESKAAYGRRSKADSPIAYLIMQAEEAIVRGETNRVAQRFVSLAKANPDPEFWTYQKVTQRRRMNPDTGLVEDYLTTNMVGEDSDWTVTAKFDGKERRVTMNKANPDARRLADAMRNLTQHQMDWVTMHLGKLNRFLSAVNTSYNPEFVITNAFRDLQTATFNLSGEEVKGLVSGTLKDYRKALVASTKGAFGKHSGEWGRWHDEFIAAGGRVYFNQVEDIGQIKKRIAGIAEMTAAKHGEGNARMQAKRLLLAGKDLIENLNLGVENAVRLSAFKNARERGMTREQAASLAKNITVNFNRRGTAGPALNAAYLFFNASIQGTARLVLAMKSKRVRRMMAGVMVAGAMLELLNAMVSDDDDDGESIYDKIPAHEKGRNLIVMTGGSEYIKIPLPYGYNMFWNAGRSAAEIARRGGKRWHETAAHFVTDFAESFNPIGGAGSLLNLIAPTAADPIVDLTMNRDFTGKPIMPDPAPYGPSEPDHQRYWGSVAPQWRAVTDFLSDATGGDQVQPGAIDVSPETLEYLSGVVIGAAGSFLDRTAGAIGKGFDPDVDVTANDLPFARKVVGEKPSWYDRSAYYDRIRAFEEQAKFAEDYLDAGDMDAARTFVDKHEAILSLEADVKQAKKDMREVRKARRENDSALEHGQIDRDAYRAEKDVIDRAEKLVIREFNTRWNEAMAAE